MPRRYHIEVYRDGPLPTYAVYLLDEIDPDPDDDEDEAAGELINEFNTREEAEALKAHLEQEDAKPPA